MTVICGRCGEVIDPDEPMKLINRIWVHVGCFNPAEGPSIE